MQQLSRRLTSRCFTRRAAFTLALAATLVCAVPGWAQERGVVKSEGGQEWGMGFVPASPSVLARSPKFTATKTARAELPRSVLLTEWLPPVGNQGRQGSCGGWATAYYVYSYAVAKQRKLTPEQRADKRFQFSPAFLYNQVNGGERLGGSNMPTLFKLMAEKGCATMAEMPYSEEDWTSQPSPAALTRGEKYKIRSAGMLAAKGKVDVNLLKTWLAEVQTPLIFCIPIYQDFPASSVGSDYVYSDTTTTVRGLHAITCVGYDDDKKAFRLVNSWGAGWGDKGFVWVSQDFIEKNLLECWGQAPGGVIARDPNQPLKVSRTFTLLPGTMVSEPKKSGGLIRRGR